MAPETNTSPPSESSAELEEEGRAPFTQILQQAYGWTLDKDDYLAGLVAGDMGYDSTDMKLSDLIIEAQVAEDKAQRALPREARSWPVHTAIMNLVAACAKSIGIEPPALAPAPRDAVLDAAVEQLQFMAGNLPGGGPPDYEDFKILAHERDVVATNIKTVLAATSPGTIPDTPR